MADTNTSFDLRAMLPDPEHIAVVTSAMLSYADAEERAAEATKRASEAAQSQAQAFVSAPASANRVSGPFSRFNNANSRYNDAIQQFRNNPDSVSGDVLNDLQYARDTAAKRLQKITDAQQPPDVAKAFMDMVGTSRIGNGSGIMPLVNRVEGLASAALGPEIAALAGPVGATVAAFVEAAKAVYQFTSAAAESGRQLSAARFQTGANNEQASRLLTYSRAFGADFAGMAGGLNERITSDPTARAYASRFGAYNIAGPNGNQNQAENLLKVVEGLRSISNEQERIRTARVLGVEGALPMTQVSNGTFNQLKTDAKTTSSVMDKGFQKDAAEFQAAQGRLAGGWEAMIAGLSKNFFPILTPLLNGIADTEYAIAAFTNGDAKASLSHLSRAASNFGMSQANVAMSAVQGGLMFPGKKAFLKNPLDQAQESGSTGGISPVEANTQMLMKVAQALGSLTQALGAGERARSATPQGLNWESFARPHELRALRLGSL